MTDHPPDRPPAALPLRDLDPDAHLGDPARKQRYVNAVFDAVAPSYDRFTHIFSFGMDVRWKRRLIRWAAEVTRPGCLVLDLACGTGDIGWAVRRLGGQTGSVLGLDPNREMLLLARRRCHAARDARSTAAGPSDRPTAIPPLRLSCADMMALPIRSASVDVVTVGYGFRNTPNAARAAAEVARVLRPGGWLFDLDFFLPESPSWRRLYLWYLRWAGRLVGRWWHGEPETYGYIARSLERWLSPSAFRALLRDAGFTVVRSEARLGGGIALHAARRGDVSHHSATF